MTALTAREPLRGVIPPIITPLTPSGHVDVASLERLVNFEVDAGVHAIFVLGTVGEGPYLTEDQQRITLETVTATVATRIPVLAGVSDIGTRRALHNAAIAQEYPIDALVSTSAFYGTVGSNENDRFCRFVRGRELSRLAWSRGGRSGVGGGAQW